MPKQITDPEEYEIKITGSGTREELIKALSDIINVIKTDKEISGRTIEYPAIIAEIT